MFDNFPKIHQFIDCLKEYNETTNIYSRNSYGMLPFHIQDSFNIANAISNSKVHVDLGSGSGLPSVIIAIASQANVIAIESKERKRLFLKYVKEALDLNNLTIFDGDVQLFTKAYSGAKISSFSAKAFAKPPKLLTYLSMFRPHQYQKESICWVPISERQRDILSQFDNIVQVDVDQSFSYFKIQMATFRSYKDDLKRQYNL